MNISDLHAKEKVVSTHIPFVGQKNKMISLQILKDNQLKEHITKVPAFLICISGFAVYEDENNIKIELKSGDYVHIEPMIVHKVSAIEDTQLLLCK